MRDQGESDGGGGQGLEFRARGAREQGPGGEELKGLGVRVKRYMAGE